MRKMILPVIAAFAFAGYAPAANAESVTVTTSFADLDLSRPEDVAKLTSRVEGNIKEACAIDYGLHNSGLYEQDCVSDAMEQANAQIEANRLAMLATVASVN